jgi:hypothetical protein
VNVPQKSPEELGGDNRPVRKRARGVLGGVDSSLALTGGRRASAAEGSRACRQRERGAVGVLGGFVGPSYRSPVARLAGRGRDLSAWAQKACCSTILRNGRHRRYSKEATC